MLPWPVGTRAPVLPSPNWTMAVPSSPILVTRTRSVGPRPYSDGTSCQRMPSTWTCRLETSGTASFARQVGQRLLLEGDPLELARGVAVAKNLASDGLAVAGSGDVPEEDGGGRIERGRRRRSRARRRDGRTSRARRSAGSIAVGDWTIPRTVLPPASVRITGRPTSISPGWMTTPAVNPPCSMCRPTSTPAPTASCVRRPGR